MSTQAIEVLGTPERELKLWRPPEQILAEATQAAKALQSVLQGKKKPVMFNGEQYLEYEDWQVLGQFFRYCVEVESTEFVEMGSVQGYKATAILKNEDTGAVISRAESMCLNNEDNWGMVTEYQWVDVLDENGKKQWDPLLFSGKGGYKREKTKVGEKAKPLFQIMSMAQTRACAKAFRNKLSWVVVLAGYKPTPWEEVGAQPDEDASQERPKGTRGKKAAPAAARTEDVKCASCGAVNGHLPSCKYHPSNLAKASSAGTGQPAQEVIPPTKETKPEVKTEAKPSTKKGVVRIVNVTDKKSSKGTAFMELTCEDDSGENGTVYVWHGHLHEELRKAKGQICLLEMSAKTRGDKTYWEVEHILEVGGVQYQDDKPLPAEGREVQGEEIPW